MSRPTTVFAIAFFGLAIVAAPLLAQGPLQNSPGENSSPFMLGTDMNRPVLYFFDIETDRMITVDLTQDPKWPGGMPLHVVVTPDARKAYLSMMGAEDQPLNVLALEIGPIDWNAETADILFTAHRTSTLQGRPTPWPLPGPLRSGAAASYAARQYLAGRQRSRWTSSKRFPSASLK